MYNLTFSKQPIFFKNFKADVSNKILTFANLTHAKLTDWID